MGRHPRLLNNLKITRQQASQKINKPSTLVDPVAHGGCSANAQHPFRMTPQGNAVIFVPSSSVNAPGTRMEGDVQGDRGETAHQSREDAAHDVAEPCCQQSPCAASHLVPSFDKPLHAALGSFTGVVSVHGGRVWPSADEEATSNAALAALVLPIKVPRMKTNPLIGRRYTPLGNTFLNWSVEPMDPVEDAQVDEPDVGIFRHTFAEFGQDRGVNSLNEFDSCMQLESSSLPDFPWKPNDVAFEGDFETQCFRRIGRRSCEPLVQALPDAAAAFAHRELLPNAVVPVPATSPLLTVAVTRVPGSVDSKGTGLVGSKSLTTLMVRNIPMWFTQDMLLDAWPNNGTYDLLYVPFNFKTKRNLGFAFVNFVTNGLAEDFRRHWHRTPLDGLDTLGKSLDVTFAHVQGRSETLKKLMKRSNCRIKNVHFQPALFSGQTRISIEDYLADPCSVDAGHIAAAPVVGGCIEASSMIAAVSSKSACCCFGV